jgi:hypothetical protein
MSMNSAPTPTATGSRASRGGVPTVLLVVLIALSVVWMGSVAVVATGGHLPKISLPTSSSSNNTPETVYLYFTITASTTGYDIFYPANVTVPVDAIVVVTIVCYDAGINNVTAPYGNVLGTEGGSATYNFSTGGAPVSMTSLEQGQIGHTFTVSYPGAAGALQIAGGAPFLNVPIPPSPNGVVPSVTTFTVVFTQTGHYLWNCLAPCDPYSMVTPGYMIGAIQVY